jgi:predicted nucleic acid-binding protein
VTTSYLLDSGVLIRALRGDIRADQLLNHLSQIGTVMISSMTVLEVLRGCRSANQESAAASILAKPDIVDLNYSVAELSAELLRSWAGVFSTEKAVPDAIIAATAMAVSSTLATLNTRQFSHLSIPGLDLLLIDQDAADWTASVH